MIVVLIVIVTFNLLNSFYNVMKEKFIVVTAELAKCKKKQEA